MTDEILRYLKLVNWLDLQSQYKTKATQFFVVWAVRIIILGQLVGKILIAILSFRVGMSKNKNTDHRINGTCAIMSIQVTYKTNHVSLLCDSTLSNALNFCFLCILF